VAPEGDLRLTGFVAVVCSPQVRDVETAPGLAEILGHFSWDVPWLVALIGAEAAYVWAFRGSRNMGRGHRHPWWKLWSFSAAILLIAAATVTPLEHYGNEVLWLNFLGFLLLTMIAAPLIAMSSPLTLALRATGPVGRSRIRRVYRGRVMSALTFPAVTWLGFAVATYAWQFSPLTDMATRNDLVRDLQQSTLLVVSVLFWWPALGCDPVRVQMNHPLRVFYIGVEMVHKGLFGGMFLSMTSPFHDGFATHLPAWAPSPMTDQRVGILILWIGGNLIFVLALVFLVRQWMLYETRNTARIDRRLALGREAARQKRLALEQVFERGV